MSETLRVATTTTFQMDTASYGTYRLYFITNSDTDSAIPIEPKKPIIARKQIESAISDLNRPYRRRFK